MGETLPSHQDGNQRFLVAPEEALSGSCALPMTALPRCHIHATPQPAAQSVAGTPP